MVEAERDRGWSGAAGSHVELLLPVRQRLLDTFITHRQWLRPIESVHLQLLDAQRIAVSLVVSVLGFRKRVDLRVRLAPALDAQGDTRRLVIALENHSLIAAALAIIGPALKLPRGIALETARITIDVDAIAAAHGFADLANHLDQASLEVKDGVLWVNAALTVKPGPVGEPLRRMPRGNGQDRDQSAVPADALPELLHGARAVCRLRIAEAFANELLALGIDQALSSGGATTRTTSPIVGQALRSLSVAFEQGTLVLEGEARVD
jgi:hypothetical protein